MKLALTPALLWQLRALAIQLVNLCDEALGLPKTIPDRATRRRAALGALAEHDGP